MSEKFDQLIRVLQKELKLTGTEIAEILWLAQQTSSNFSGQKIQDSSNEPKTIIKDVPEDIPADIPKDRPFDILSDPPPPTNVIQPEPSTAVVTPQTSKTSSGSGLSIKLPDRSSLPYPLKIAKALRPLIQYIAFGKAVLLDENATVELTAELNGVCIPVLKPQLELRFDLTVVIDKSDSMIFWQGITKELEQILKHYGIFRNIQTFGMVENEQGDICLRQEISKKKYSTQKLIDPSGRRLILVVSDCVSEIWRNGKAFDLLKIWGKHNVVAIVQMLPEKMWLRTGLSLGTMVQLDSLIPAVSNRNLFIKEILIWDYIDQNSIKVPVFSLTQNSIETWSQMVTGKGNIGAGGFAFSSLQEQEKESDEQSQLTIEERIHNFRVSSSPVARKLASLLASAPVINLPVVRLIQNLINKNNNLELPQIHVIAEVFLGGILKPTKEITPDTDPDYVQYHFIDEKIRDSLLSDSSRVKSREIIEIISEYFAKQLGKNLKEFYALLKKPDELEKLKTEKNVTDFDVKHFATITTKVLKRLGGDYARFAEEIEQSQNPQRKDTEPSIFQVFAGEYTCSVKWGGETGIWRKESQPEHLWISPQGEVQFRSRFGLAVIQNLTINEQRLSWNFGDNQTAASITFKVNSEDSYFWGDNQTGKLFQGWLNYPKEGKIDFRGRLVISDPLQGFPPIQDLTFEAVNISVEDDDVNYNLQSFEFEVALITGIKEANTTNPIEVANNLVFSQTEKHLTEVEQLIIQETISDKTYEQIAASSNCSTEYLKELAYRLWEIFSTALGEKVNKRNFKNVIQLQVNNSLINIRRSRQTANYFIEELNGVQLEMVSIPEGNFTMGSPKEEPARFSDESPQHEVTVPAFFMGKYTVTQAQWQAVAYLPQVNRELKPDPSKFKGANKPVEQVSWYDAVEFCQRLTAHTKRQYRLPSEAEWEYACRAGTTSPFHFGETITSELANYDATSIYGRGVKGSYREETTPVGSFKAANNFGLYDMHGNVWELCLDDWHSNYEGAPGNGSAWFDDNNNLSQKQGKALLRGGSWVYSPKYCRSASRSNDLRAERVDVKYSIGFRVVCAVGRILQ